MTTVGFRLGRDIQAFITAEEFPTHYDRPAFYLAVVGDLTLPATSGPPRRARNFGVAAPTNVGFTVMNLRPDLAQPGHNRPVEVTFQFLLVVRPVIELSGRYSASKLMNSLPQPGHDLPFISAPDRTPEGLLHSATCRVTYSSISTLAVNRPDGRFGQQCAGKPAFNGQSGSTAEIWLAVEKSPGTVPIDPLARNPQLTSINGGGIFLIKWN